jgi:hypothetical protein
MKQGATLQLRSPARKGVAVEDVTPHFGGDLADWLQEVAKRPWVEGPPSVVQTVVAEAPKSGREQRLRRHLQHGRDLAGLAVLTVGYLQYYYLDVVQVGDLPKVVYFVPLAAS